MRADAVIFGIALWLLPISVSAEQTLMIPSQGKDANQLHEELLQQFPEFGGMLNPRTGHREDPGLLRVESIGAEIRLTCPDGAPVEEIQAVVNRHAPTPRQDVAGNRRAAKQKLKSVGLNQEELDALFP